MTRTISLSVPATLHHKPLLLCATSVAAQETVEHEAPRALPLENLLQLEDAFTSELVSAVSELVNNIVLHGYAGAAGTMEFQFTTAPGYLEVEIREQGASFDIAQVTSPQLDDLPEGGMGLFIVRSFVDELWYEPGPVNIWSMVKYRSAVATRARKKQLARSSRRVAILPDDGLSADGNGDRLRASSS